MSTEVPAQVSQRMRQAVWGLLLVAVVHMLLSDRWSLYHAQVPGIVDSQARRPRRSRTLRVEVNSRYNDPGIESR